MATIKQKPRKCALVLGIIALLLRIILPQLSIICIDFKLPKVVFVTIELLLLFGVLYLERHRLKNFFICKIHVWRAIGFGILLSFPFCAFDGLFSWIGGEQYNEITWSVLLIFPFLIPLAVLRAALYEELLFRSIVLRYLLDYCENQYVANAIQSSLFLLAHIRYFTAEEWWTAAIIWINGFLWGLVVIRWKNVIVTTVVHSMINTYGFLFLSTSRLETILPTLFRLL
jgi:membrane protease YdiL (CAAX protease family)